MDQQLQQMLQQLNARLDDQAQRTAASEARANLAEQALVAARLETAQLQGQMAQQQANMPAMDKSRGGCRSSRHDPIQPTIDYYCIIKYYYYYY